MSAGPGAFVVARADLTGPTTLSDQLSLFLTSFPGGTTFNGTSKITIKGDVPGYRVTAEWPAGETRLRGIFVLGVKGARVFSLGAFARSDVFDKYGDDFGRTTDSLRITLDSVVEPIEPTGVPLETLDVIGDRVTKIRGLSPPSGVNPRLLSREEFAERVESELVDDQMRHEAERLKGICVPLDLCSVSDNLLEFRLILLRLGVLGYYNPEGRSLTTVTRQAELDPLAWLTHAHEYTHALQDHHFGLSNLLGQGQTTIDESRALLALVEGDARLSDNLFYETLPVEQQALVVEALDRASQNFASSLGAVQLPPIIIATFGWEQFAGSKFAYVLFLNGGFSFINHAYENPPRSTEQILHPEKYTSGEQPHLVELPQLAPALGDTWRQRDTGVLGEFLTSVYLGAFLTDDQAGRAAQGWGGDRYTLVEDDQGRLLMVMRYSWDTEEDAAQFFQAYLDLVDKKSGGEWDAVVSEDANRLWEGDNVSVHLSLEGFGTLVIIGPDRPTVDTVLEVIPNPATGG